MQSTLLALALIVGAETARQEWTVDSAKREALVHKPAKTSAAPPLVFVFHGHGGNMRQAARRMNLHDLWPEAVVVYPQGLPTRGVLTDPEGKRPGWQHAAADEGGRDLKFFDAMLESLQKDLKTDPARVYVTGHSNGGAFTYLLWAERHAKLAAVAPSAAANRHARALKPLPCLHFAGEKDPLVKFEWQQNMLAQVRKANGCEEKSKAAGDKVKFYPSKGGTPLVLFAHPGGHEYHDEAPALTVKFFKEHANKKAK